MKVPVLVKQNESVVLELLYMSSDTFLVVGRFVFPALTEIADVVREKLETDVLQQWNKKILEVVNYKVRIPLVAWMIDHSESVKKVIKSLLVPYYN